MNILQQLNDDLSSTVETARRGLVEIHNGRGGAGAGIVWRGDGLIVTNAHVLSRGHLKVKLQDGRVFPARVVAHDVEHDVAALAIDANGLAAIPVGDSGSLKPGEWVVALGHPWGVVGAASAGIVIGTGADLPEMPGNREWIAVSLHLRPGHSGGPLVDRHGRVVGINTMINGPDVGVAVPVDVVKQFMARVGKVEQPPAPQSNGSMIV